MNELDRDDIPDPRITNDDIGRLIIKLEDATSRFWAQWLRRRTQDFTIGLGDMIQAMEEINIKSNRWFDYED